MAKTCVYHVLNSGIDENPNTFFLFFSFFLFLLGTLRWKDLAGIITSGELEEIELRALF